MYLVGLRPAMFSVVDAGATLAGQNLLGEGRGGWIELKGRAFSAEMRLKKRPDQPPSADIRVPGFHSGGERGFSLHRIDPDHAVRCFSYPDAEGERRRSTASPYATNSTAVSADQRDVQWDVDEDMWSQVFPVKMALLGDGERLEANRRVKLGLYLVLGITPEYPHRGYERISLASIVIQSGGDGDSASLGLKPNILLERTE